MAKEIRETPILKGKDAARFQKTIKENENQKVAAADYQRAKHAYESVSFGKKAD